LREEGFEVHVAALSRKTLFTVVRDFEPGWATYTEKPGYRFP
jgi:protease I